MKQLIFVATGIFLLLLEGCNSLKSVRQVLLKTSPYEEYVQSLGKAGLKETALGKSWIAAGKKVFDDSITVNLPFTESGFFEDNQPQANGYNFHVFAGQVLTVKVRYQSAKASTLFADLFIKDNTKWTKLMHADSSLSISYEFDKDQECLLRIQPELLSNTWYSLTITLSPALINPVKGANNHSIKSFYGNARDNGARSHEGIDIFAPRGTPVIAPADGIVYNAGMNHLGGKVVWLYDPQRGQNYYFAHLDSQWVNIDLHIKKGDTLGQVGNTGNAEHTPAHLHFGIYRNGSKDPLHYVQTLASIEPAVIDTSIQTAVYKISVKEGKLHRGPSSKVKVSAAAEKGTYVKRTAQSGEWFRISLPDQQPAYVHRNDVSLALKGKRLVLKTNDTLWSTALNERLPKVLLKASDQVEVLAQYKGYGYVKTPQKIYGWLKL